MRRQRREFGVAQRRTGCSASTAAISACSAADQHGASALASTVARTCSSVRCAAGAKSRDMHAPFIFASGERAGAVDHDLALAQGERPAVEQAAAAEFLPGPRLAGDTRNNTSGGAPRMMPVELLPGFPARKAAPAARCVTWPAPVLQYP